jgi:hypothetical protein
VPRPYKEIAHNFLGISPQLELVAYLHKQQVLIKLLTRYMRESYLFPHELPFMAKFQEHEYKGILQLPGQCLGWICMQLACNDPGVEHGWFIKQVIPMERHGPFATPISVPIPKDYFGGRSKKAL